MPGRLAPGLPSQARRFVFRFGGMVGDLFLQVPRTDLTARLHNEPAYDFLNRCADPFIDDIRQLMAGWLSHVSSEHADELRRRLQGKG
jgi:hypothetical protein